MNEEKHERIEMIEMIEMIEIGRRSFLGGLIGSVIAAPAVVHAANIMPVRTPTIWRQKLIPGWKITRIEWDGKANATLTLSWALGLETEPRFANLRSIDNVHSFQLDTVTKVVHAMDGSKIIEGGRVGATIDVPAADRQRYMLGDMIDWQISPSLWPLQ